MSRRAPKTGTPRTSVVGVRVPPEQREAIEAAAAAAGMTASAFVAEAMAKFVAAELDISESVANLRARASSAAIAAVNSAPAPANDARTSVNSGARDNTDVNRTQAHALAAHTDYNNAVNNAARAVDTPSEVVNKGAAAATHEDYAERQASLDELERELAALLDEPTDRPVNTAVNKASTTTSAPASAVNNPPPVKVSGSIPVYGQVPSFTYIGTLGGISTQSLTDQRVRVPTWQTPSDRPRGGLRLRPVAPTPPIDPDRRLRPDLKQLLFGPRADAPKRSEPPVNRADPAVLHELKRIGNNINQIAHAVNTGLPPDITLTVQSFRQLFEALTDDVEFRRRLDAIRTRTEFNGTAHPQSRRGLP